MLLLVSVQRMDGDVVELPMSHRSVVLDLKQRLYRSSGVKPSEQAIVPRDQVRCLDDGMHLLRLVDWFVLSDVMSSRAMKAMTFELTLRLVIKPKLCGFCDRPAVKKCER